MQLVQIFPRESQEMVFEAHERAFRFFGGVCRRGIYDNMKTAVSTVFVGKKRDYNRRFQEMCTHHLVEPVACTPGAGWEKGQVERQVGDVRGRLFVPSPRGRSCAEINEWLMDRCIEDARKHPHPTIPGKTVWQVFEEERPFLTAYRGPFDGFHATEVAVSKTCLVRFDNNQYSVAARAVGRPVDVRAYADRIVIRQDGEIVAEHPRSFGRGRIVYDPWHYVPILTKKPRLPNAPGSNGSSPRGRGTLVHHRQHGAPDRFIPAWAGNARIRSRWSVISPVHPRVGGERCWPRIACASLIGSSPRGRGTLCGGYCPQLRGRFIPAWAGNAMRGILPATPGTVHPRVGGERAWTHAQGFSVDGSSPRGRGTPSRSSIK